MASCLKDALPAGRIWTRPGTTRLYRSPGRILVGGPSRRACSKPMHPGASTSPARGIRSKRPPGQRRPSRWLRKPVRAKRIVAGSTDSGPGAPLSGPQTASRSVQDRFHRQKGFHNAKSLEQAASRGLSAGDAGRQRGPETIARCHALGRQAACRRPPGAPGSSDLVPPTRTPVARQATRHRERPRVEGAPGASRFGRRGVDQYP